MLTLNDYQRQAREVSFYKDIPMGEVPVYPMLGLAGEVGEVAEQLKKAVRDDGGKLTEERLAKLLRELGDCAWYLSDLCGKLGFDLEDVCLSDEPRKAPLAQRARRVGR